eukprot:TRINITY_DN25683_c0_g2_i1.p1 TRINITY_DN25683_c0_g2~~TRINITY_DN25683_c0_g2_i1.p1  ORF type:complete len:541 (-),score=67.46 TRINITY_DN25683_c0_g2_i1:24-1646(-)
MSHRSVLSRSHFSSAQRLMYCTQFFALQSMLSGAHPTIVCTHAARRHSSSQLCSHWLSIRYRNYVFLSEADCSNPVLSSSDLSDVMRRASFMTRLEEDSEGGGAGDALLLKVAFVTLCATLLVSQGYTELVVGETHMARRDVAVGFRDGGCAPDLTENLGLPVYLSCKVQRQHDFGADERLQLESLPDFQSELRGAWFTANSEIYQWNEVRSCNVLGESCNYTYLKHWSRTPINSEDFFCMAAERREGCSGAFGDEIRNTGEIPKQLRRTLYAPVGSVTLGELGSDVGFGLNEGMMAGFEATTVLLAREQKSKKVDVMPDHYVKDVGGGKVSFQKREDELSIGDVRTVFSRSLVIPGISRLSVLGQQAKAARTADNRTVVPLVSHKWQRADTGEVVDVDWSLEGSWSLQQLVHQRIPMPWDKWCRVRVRFFSLVAVFWTLRVVIGSARGFWQIVEHMAVASAVVGLVAFSMWCLAQPYCYVLLTPIFLGVALLLLLWNQTTPTRRMRQSPPQHRRSFREELKTAFAAEHPERQEEETANS